jgi:hypothetical protein
MLSNIGGNRIAPAAMLAIPKEAILLIPLRLAWAMFPSM